MMALCRFVVLWSLFVTLVVCQLVNSGERKGCGMASLRSRNTVSGGKLHIDVSSLIRGIKRSTEDDEDCNEKKSSIDIKQSAVSAVPGQNEYSDKKSNVLKGHDRDYLMLPNHKINTNSNLLGLMPKRGSLLAKPSTKTLKNSPLWSLSKLIEEVDSVSADKKTTKKNNTENEEFLKETSSEITPKAQPLVGDNKKITETGIVKTKLEKPTVVTKTNLAIATDASKGIKATLSKAIEKVEKVIASRNANAITPNKAAIEEETHVKRTNSTGPIETTSAVTKSNATILSPEPRGKPKEIDPYAEIAAGPDRPKIPELKSDSTGGSDGPVMKYNNAGGVKQLDSATAIAKDEKPLSGEHDVGGLLDKLTDKLNKGGGNIAMESSPMTESPNNVNYVQSNVGQDDAPVTGLGDSQDKQLQAFGLDKLKDEADHNDVQKMTEQDGLLAGNGDTQTASQQAQAAAAATAAAAESAAIETAASAPSETAASETTANTHTAPARDELANLIAGATGASQSDQEQSDQALDKEALEYTGAGGHTGDEDGFAKSLSKASSMTSSAIMDMLKSAKIPNSDEYSNADVTAGPDPYAQEGESEQQTGGESFGSLLGGTKSAGTPSNSEYDAADIMNSPNNFARQEQESEDVPGDTRSIGGQTQSEDEDDYRRDNVPDEETYRDKYNTELFKKHIIMRPKRDKYVSPFNGKEAFDTAI